METSPRNPAVVFKSDLQQTLCRWFIEATALGDALGATTEFMSITDAVATVVSMRSTGYPWKPVGGGWLGLPPGAHTDDTDMTLGLLHALLSGNGQFDAVLVAANWSDWVASRPPDVGASIRAVVSTADFAEHPYEASRAFYRANPKRCANGALMRNGIIVAAAPDSATGFEWSLKQGIMTHYAPLSVLCCAVQTWLIFQLHDKGWPFDLYDDWMEQWHSDWTKWVSSSTDPVVCDWLDEAQERDALNEAMDAICNADFDPDTFNPFTYPDLAEKQGWCLLSLQIAVWAMQWSVRRNAAHPFPVPDAFAAVKNVFTKRRHYTLGWIPLIGHDADTYGAIAGPLILCACGKPFPERMVKSLKVRSTSWLYGKVG